MLPSAVDEQQAKLGVSAEESKAQRLQRQQARFRDRGGTFVPSDSNPLVDILLARTVSGESPSKRSSKGIPTKRPSSSKHRRSSPTRKASAATVSVENQTVAGSSKSKAQATQKRASKIVEPQGEGTKPTAKRRGRPAKSNTKRQDSDTEKPSADTKPTSKGKRKQPNPSTATSTSEPITKTKTKTKLKTKPTPIKEVVEVLRSDDDQTLVEVPHRTNSNPKKYTRHEDDDGTDDDVPLAPKRVLSPVGDSGLKAAKRVKGQGTTDPADSGKKSKKEKRTRDETYAKTSTKKQLVLLDGDGDEDVVPRPIKKGKSNVVVVPEPVLHATKKGKDRADPHRDILAEQNDDDRRPTISKKRKKEVDNYGDRPRKVVKFVETNPPCSSSQKLKENQSNKKQNTAAKASIKGEPDVLHPKLATKLTSRATTSKGPPREVLERIKASAARYLQCADGEPDELDCLS